MKTFPFFHKVGALVLYRGQRAFVTDRKQSKTGKLYCLKDAEGHPIKFSGTTWIREAYIMKYFDFDNRK
jgi:hypothetical protein